MDGGRRRISWYETFSGALTYAHYGSQDAEESGGWNGDNCSDKGPDVDSSKGCEKRSCERAYGCDRCKETDRNRIHCDCQEEEHKTSQP